MAGFSFVKHAQLISLESMAVQELVTARKSKEEGKER
jgi:hypothetical protein